MEYHHQYDAIMKHFGESRQKNAGTIQKDLHLYYINITLYYTDKFALWLGFQTIDDNKIYGSARRLENTLEGIPLQITKEAGSVGYIYIYIYTFYLYLLMKTRLSGGNILNYIFY